MPLLEVNCLKPTFSLQAHLFVQQVIWMDIIEYKMKTNSAKKLKMPEKSGGYLLVSELTDLENLS